MQISSLLERQLQRRDKRPGLGDDYDDDDDDAGSDVDTTTWAGVSASSISSSSPQVLADGKVWPA
ncbi:hypothetical protein L13192_01719 [Pyrenophora tritici-repentis]|uniref:Uncharacterized protein n=1 Tax=Pyrenophora tritici-repentis TaxID=45151 RepID=A0A922NMN6_9PLEO|nr:hypothetical protein Ptr86124_001037 [Pyrenophora tritici-repentis]KAI1674972.1 hypothetical protein L13192_01719 [Pyrenophora tritici-repentis]